MRTCSMDENIDKKSEQMATAVIFLMQRAPFVRYLSSLPAFAIACSLRHRKKNFSVDRLSSLGYYYLFFFLHSEMNDRGEKTRTMYAETIEKKRKRTRRTFFFCLLSKCSIRLFFFSPSASQKKSGKKRRIVFNSSNTILSLYVLYVCACSSSSPSVFFFSVYIRAHLASANIHQCEERRKKKSI